MALDPENRHDSDRTGPGAHVPVTARAPVGSDRSLAAPPPPPPRPVPGSAPCAGSGARGTQVGRPGLRATQRRERSAANPNPLRLVATVAQGADGAPARAEAGTENGSRPLSDLLFHSNLRGAPAHHFSPRGHRSPRSRARGAGVSRGVACLDAGDHGAAGKGREEVRVWGRGRRDSQQFQESTWKYRHDGLSSRGPANGHQERHSLQSPPVTCRKLRGRRGRLPEVGVARDLKCTDFAAWAGRTAWKRPTAGDEFPPESHLRFRQGQELVSQRRTQRRPSVQRVAAAGEAAAGLQLAEQPRIGRA